MTTWFTYSTKATQYSIILYTDDSDMTSYYSAIPTIPTNTNQGNLYRKLSDFVYAPFFTTMYKIIL